MSTKQSIPLLFLSALMYSLYSCAGLSSETAELDEDKNDTHHITGMGLYAFCECWVTSPINEGIVQFEKDNKYGFMDTTGKIIVPAKYEITNWWSEGRGGLKNCDLRERN